MSHNTTILCKIKLFCTNIKKSWHTNIDTGKIVIYNHFDYKLKGVLFNDV